LPPPPPRRCAGSPRLAPSKRSALGGARPPGFRPPPGVRVIFGRRFSRLSPSLSAPLSSPRQGRATPAFLPFFLPPRPNPICLLSCLSLSLSLSLSVCPACSMCCVRCVHLTPAVFCPSRSPTLAPYLHSTRQRKLAPHSLRKPNPPWHGRTPDAQPAPGGWLSARSSAGRPVPARARGLWIVRGGSGCCFRGSERTNVSVHVRVCRNPRGVLVALTADLLAFRALFKFLKFLRLGASLQQHRARAAAHRHHVLVVPLDAPKMPLAALFTCYSCPRDALTAPSIQKPLALWGE
jgi:hypothetical protein